MNLGFLGKSERPVSLKLHAAGSDAGQLWKLEFTGYFATGCLNAQPLSLLKITLRDCALLELTLIIGHKLLLL